MKFQERGEFVLSSNIEYGSVGLEVRMPHAISGLNPLVFAVIISETLKPTTLNRQPRHQVIIQHDSPYLLVSRWLTSRMGDARPERSHYGYLNASLFDFQGEPEEYNVSSLSTGWVQGYGRVVAINDTVQGSKSAILREGEKLIFEVREEKGSNRIILPSDLRPYAGGFMQSGVYVSPQADLLDVVEFSTYEA